LADNRKTQTENNSTLANSPNRRKTRNLYLNRITSQIAHTQIRGDPKFWLYDTTLMPLILPNTYEKGELNLTHSVYEPPIGKQAYTGTELTKATPPMNLLDYNKSPDLRMDSKNLPLNTSMLPSDLSTWKPRPLPHRNNNCLLNVAFQFLFSISNIRDILDPTRNPVKKDSLIGKIQEILCLYSNSAACSPFSSTRYLTLSNEIMKEIIIKNKEEKVEISIEQQNDASEILLKLIELLNEGGGTEDSSQSPIYEIFFFQKHHHHLR
jgi:hypothetical protein